MVVPRKAKVSSPGFEGSRRRNDPKKTPMAKSVSKPKNLVLNFYGVKKDFAGIKFFFLWVCFSDWPIFRSGTAKNRPQRARDVFPIGGPQGGKRSSSPLSLKSLPCERRREGVAKGRNGLLLPRCAGHKGVRGKNAYNRIIGFFPRRDTDLTLVCGSGGLGDDCGFKRWKRGFRLYLRIQRFGL